MKNLELSLTKEAQKKDYKWLIRDFKQGEQVYLFMGSTYGCVSNNGLACTVDGNESFFELPINVLSVKHEGVEYGIFMTEKKSGNAVVYCKALPFNRTDLLSKIQLNAHLTNSAVAAPSHKPENKIIKVIIEAGKVKYENGQLEDVTPLF